MKRMATITSVTISALMILSLLSGCAGNPAPTATITLDKPELELAVGDTADIAYTIVPEGTAVSFVSSDTGILMVNEDGKVAAVAEGEAAITLSAENAESVQVKATVKGAAEDEAPLTTVTGVVKEATMNTMLLELEDGSELALSTTDADVSGVGEHGILIGTTLTVEYREGENAAVATKLTFVKAPADSDTEDAASAENSGSAENAGSAVSGEMPSSSSSASSPASGGGTTNTPAASSSASSKPSTSSGGKDISKMTAKERAEIIFADANLEIFDWTTPAVNYGGASYSSTYVFEDANRQALAYFESSKEQVRRLVEYGYENSIKGMCDAFNDYRGIGSSSSSAGSPSSAGSSSKPSTDSSANEPPESQPDEGTGDVHEAIRLINAERVAAGLDALKADETVMSMAQTRADECASVGSLDVDGKAHTRPDGSDWKTVFTDNGLEIPKKRGENCGYGTSRSTAASQVNAWMKSSGHKANIMQEGITKIGVGYANSDGTHYWVMIVSQ